MALPWKKNTDFECGSTHYLERIRDVLGYDTSTIPFKLLRPKSGGFAIKWEAWPNAAYECYWMDQDGKMAADM